MLETPLRLLAVLFLALVSGTAITGQTLDEARELYASGEVDAALTMYERVAEEAGQDDPTSAATALNNLCFIANGLGRFEKARLACERAIVLRKMTGDERRLARSLNNYALALQNLGEYDQARTNYLEALEINERLDDVPSRVLNLANLGALETVAGEYGRALSFHDQAAVLAAENATEPWAQEQLLITDANRGVVLERLGAYREALEIYRSLLDDETGQPDIRRRAQVKLNAGVIYRNLGDPVRAAREFEEVAEIYRQLDDADGLSNALLNLALAYHLNFDDPQRAESAYREALELASRHSDRPEVIQDLFYLGQFLLDQGRLDEAEEMFRRCLSESEASQSREGRWSALSGLGRIAVARNRPRVAIEQFERARAEIEQVGANLPEARLLSGYFGEKRPLFSAAVRAHAALEELDPGSGHAARALEIVQQAKARALLDELGAGEWSAEPLTAIELQRSADNGMIVEYFIAEGDLLRWSIRSDLIALDNLGPVAPVSETIHRLFELLSDGLEPPAKLLESLGRLLPDGADLADGDPLFLALDGPLHRLPFTLLPFPGSSATPLVERLTLSYLPSASTLAWLRERDRRQPLPVRESVTAIAVGSPDISALRGNPRSPAGLFAARYGLEPLPAVTRELETVQRYLRGRTRIANGAGATETAFRSISAPARVLHIATHAISDESSGRSPAILLGPDEEADGLLDPREIAALDQRATLTVLSACRTASRSSDGAALTTLAGAFLASGSSAVVATLWDVQDDAAAAFMDQFYYQLSRGTEPAIALRKAQMRLREDAEWKSPHLWAGYVLIGDAAAPVSTPLLSEQRLVVLGIGLFLAALIAMRIVRGRRSTV